MRKHQEHQQEHPISSSITTASLALAMVASGAPSIQEPIVDDKKQRVTGSKAALFPGLDELEEVKPFLRSRRKL